MKKKKQPRLGRFSRTQIWRNLRLEVFYSLPMLLGLAIIVLFPTMWGTACGGIVGGFTGIIIMRQRKAPSAYWTIEGTPAVILGALIVVIAWGGALLGILAYLFHW